MTPHQSLTEINRQALDAAFDYKTLLLSQPAETLDMLARHVDSAPGVCMGVLRDLGAELGQKLLAYPSHGAQRSLDGIAEHCACDDFEGLALDRLFAAFPALWQIADHHLIFHALAGTINSSQETHELPDQAAHRAAERAHAWLGSGLSDRAWLALAEAGGPAWRAFSSAHASYAQKGSGREPTELTVGQLGWRAAKRLERSLGSTGFGASMHWLYAVSEHPTFSNRLEAAAGLSSLIAEARAERSQPEGYPDGSRFGSLFAKTITQALFFSQDNALWDDLARTALAALIKHDPNPALVLVNVPLGFGLFGSDAPATIKTPLTSAATMVAPGLIPLADLLLMHPRSFWRARGFELGASAESAQTAFNATTTGKVLTLLGDLAQTKHSTPGCRAHFEVLRSMVEQWSLALSSDASRFKLGDFERTSPKSSPPRL